VTLTYMCMLIVSVSTIGCIPNLKEIVQIFFESYEVSTMSQLPTVI
jgi:hypothetical protein